MRRRVRRRTGKAFVAVAALLVALAAAGLAIGGEVIGIFDVHGKRIPLNSLSPREQEFLADVHVPTSGAPRRAFESSPQGFLSRGRSEYRRRSRSDGSQVHYRIRYPWGLTCVGSGPAGGRARPDHRLPEDLGPRLQMPAHPGTSSCRPPDGRSRSMPRSALPPENLQAFACWVCRAWPAGVWRASAVIEERPPLKVPVHDHAYAFGAIPDRPWIAVAAYDRDGRRVYRESSAGIGRLVPRLEVARTAKSSVWSPGPPKRPSEAPLQHADDA